MIFDLLISNIKVTILPSLLGKPRLLYILQQSYLKCILWVNGSQKDTWVQMIQSFRSTVIWTSVLRYLSYADLAE